MRPHLWLVRIISRIVPRRFRSEWKQEWEAELHHREWSLAQKRKLNRQARWDLFRRSAGAFWDAASLQPQRLEDEMFQDLRYATRMFFRDLGFALTAVLTLGLGLGASTALFSLMDAALLEPLPYPNPQQVIALWDSSPAQNLPETTLSLPNFLDLRRQSKSLAALAAYTQRSATLQEDGSSESVGIANVTADFFEVLDAPPLMGRFPSPREIDSRAPMAVLSEAFWRRHFGGDPQIVNRLVKLNGEGVQVIGIFGSQFAFPEHETEFWIPMFTRPDWDRRSRFLSVIGRVKPAFTATQANAELTGLMSKLAEQYPADNSGWTVKVVPLQEEVIGESRPMLVALSAGALLLLLVGCSNAAGLILSRAVARSREVSIRFALGASRIRVARQLLTESFLLSAMACSAGLGLAWAGLRLLVVLDWGGFPRVSRAALNLRVVGFAAAAAIVCAVLSSTVTLWRHCGKPDPTGLKEAGRGLVTGAGQHIRSVLVSAQVSLAFVLLVIMILFGQTLLKLMSQPVGFQRSHLLVAVISLDRSKYRSNAQVVDYFERLGNDLRQLPGTESVGAVTALPMSQVKTDFDTQFRGPANAELADGDAPEGAFRTATPNYFATMRIPLLKGRGFPAENRGKAQAEQPLQVIINESLARTAFGDEDPVGKRLMIEYDGWKGHEVLGVVADTRSQGLREQPRPEMYFPNTLYPWYGQMNVAVRTSGSFESETLRRAILAFDPATPPRRIDEIGDLIGNTVLRERASLVLAAFFAVSALVLTMIGIYGLLAYSVRVRTPEIAVRIVLGAQRTTIANMILTQGCRLMATGLLMGLFLSIIAARFLETLLFGVSPTNAAAYALAFAIVAVAGLAGTALPAYLAARLNPARTLRGE